MSNPVYAEIAAQFVQDCCEMATPGFTTVKDMHAAFAAWAQARKASKTWKWWIYCDTQSGMSRGMTALGIQRHKTPKGTNYAGIILRQPIAPTNPAS